MDALSVDLCRDPPHEHSLTCWYGARRMSSCWQSTSSRQTFPSRKRTAWPYKCDERRSRIPANIAEGFRRRGHADKARFMNMAEGSIEKCRYYLILARDLEYGDTFGLNNILEEVSRMLNAYAAAILATDS